MFRSRGSRASLPGVVAAVVVALLAGGCAARTESPPNLVIICIDTLRVDHVGVYGHERPTTPSIDALAQRGTRFELASATAPWTVPSTVSILTSLMPSDHGSVRTGRIKEPRNRPREMRPNVATLPGVLRRAGYRSAFLSANSFIRGRILADFDRAENKLRGASKIAREASIWLEQNAEGPFFLYLQPFDLHAPIEPPAPYFNMFEAPAGGERTEEHKDWLYTKATDVDDEEFIRYSQHKRALYDGALRYVDDTIAELLELLSDLGVADRTFVVVTSDHGEEFWDHAEVERRLGGDTRQLWGVGHGHSLFQELLHVPLVVAGPGVAEGRTVPCPISLIDLAPTLLELMGIPRAATMRGESQAALVRRGADPGTCAMAPVYAGSPAFGVDARSILFEGRYKLIERRDGVRLLYDLQDDPEEQHDLAAERPDLTARLGEMFARTVEPSETAEEMEIDEETLEQLNALGYIE